MLGGGETVFPQQQTNWLTNTKWSALKNIHVSNIIQTDQGGIYAFRKDIWEGVVRRKGKGKLYIIVSNNRRNNLFKSG